MNSQLYKWEFMMIYLEKLCVYLIVPCNVGITRVGTMENIYLGCL